MSGLPPHPAAPDPADTMRALAHEGRFPEVLATFRALDPERLPADLMLLAATAATRIGDLDQGSTAAAAALERFRQRADQDGRMRALNLLGVIAFEQGRMSDAFQAFNEALDLARQLRDHLLIARTSNNLASLTYLRNDTLGALTLFRSALLSYQRLGDPRGMAESYHNLGIVFREMEKWMDANAASDQAVRLAEQVGEAGLAGLASTGKAEIHVALDELPLAQQRLSRARQLVQEAGDEIGLIETGRVQALIHLSAAAYEAAAAEAEAARREAEKSRASVLQAECAALAAQAHRATGNDSMAEARRTEALELFQSQGAIRRLEQFKQAWDRQ